MMSDWKNCSLGDVVELKRGYDLPQKERLPGHIPLVSSSGVTDTHAKAMVKGPGVVTGRYGTLGQVFYVEQDFWPLNTTLYVRDFKGNDQRFISYFLRNIDFLAYSDKAAVPGLNRNHLHQAEVRIPTNPTEQRAIAHILGTLDDKIELNRKQNETLEAMAHALFKAWFVDFEPVRAKLEGRWQRGESLPGLPAHLYDLFPDRLVESELGEIPEGWEVKTIGDFVVIKRGGSPRPIQDFIRPSGIPWVKIADATSATSRFLFQTKEFIKEEGLKKTVLLKNGALILSNSATPGLPMFLELDACIHDGWLYFPQKHMFSDLYLYQLFLEIRDELVAQGNGSVFTNLKTDILRSQKIVVASKVLLRGFDSLATPLFNKLLGLNTESRTLAQLRDTLLPKLISGELRIPDAEAFLKERGL